MVPLNKRIFMMIPAITAAMGLGWVVTAQDKQPTWKGKDGGREEYDIEQKAEKAADAKGRLAALDEWKAKFPDTDFLDLREDFYLVTYSQLNDCRKSFDTAGEIRKRRAKHFLSLNTQLTCVYQLGATPSRPDLAAAEGAAKYILDNAGSNTIFAANNKPLTMTVEQLAAAKVPIEKAAQQTYAWVFVKREEWAKAEPEIRKFLASDPSQAAFTLYLAQALSAQARANPTGLVNKYIESMFHYARAASYSGPNALPQAAKDQAKTFLESAYKGFHGSDEGLQQVLTIASTNVMPPAGWTIKDINTINKEKFEAQQAIDAANPELTFWRDVIKGPLTGPNGAMVFDQNFKDALLPGPAATGFTKFKGTIVDHTDEKGNTKALRVRVADPTTPDATLEFIEPLPGTMEPGGQIMFEGAAKSFVASPFMITLEVTAEQVEGWTGVAPKGKAGKAPANKGGKAGKNKAK